MLSTKRTISKILIDWDDYRPAPVMQAAIDNFNRLPLNKLLANMPAVDIYIDLIVSLLAIAFIVDSLATKSRRST